MYEIEDITENMEQQFGTQDERWYSVVHNMDIYRVQLTEGVWFAYNQEDHLIDDEEWTEELIKQVKEWINGKEA